MTVYYNTVKPGGSTHQQNNVPARIITMTPANKSLVVVKPAKVVSINCQPTKKVG